MSDLQIGVLAIGLMLAGIYFGMHVGIALIATSFVGVTLMKGPDIASRFVAAAANDAIRDYLFGVVPLFVLMGMFVSVSGMGRDTFDVFQWLLRKVRGGLGLATVGANAVFAAITGISIASASVFTKVAVPEMIRHGYSPRFSVGVVAGSGPSSTVSHTSPSAARATGSRRTRGPKSPLPGFTAPQANTTNAPQNTTPAATHQPAAASPHATRAGSTYTTPRLPSARRQSTGGGCERPGGGVMVCQDAAARAGVTRNPPGINRTACHSRRRGFPPPQAGQYRQPGPPGGSLSRK